MRVKAAAARLTGQPELPSQQRQHLAREARGDPVKDVDALTYPPVAAPELM